MWRTLIIIIITYFGNTQAVTNFINRKKKNLPSMYMDDKIENLKIGNPHTDSEDIQWRYRDGIGQKICHVNNEKWTTINDGRNRITKSRKYENARRSRHHQTSRDERKKIKKNTSGKLVNYPSQTTLQKSHQREKNIWAVLLVRYLGPFLKWTREELQQMGQRKK